MFLSIREPKNQSSFIWRRPRRSPYLFFEPIRDPTISFLPTQEKFHRERERSRERKNGMQTIGFLAGTTFCTGGIDFITGGRSYLGSWVSFLPFSPLVLLLFFFFLCFCNIFRFVSVLILNFLPDSIQFPFDLI